jgi:hypothetical protein
VTASKVDFFTILEYLLYIPFEMVALNNDACVIAVMRASRSE